MKKPKQKRFSYDDERPYYHDDERPYYRPRYRSSERRGFWYRLKRFLYGVLITLIVLSLAMLILGIVFLVYAYRLYINAYIGIFVKVLLGVGGVLLALLLLRAMVAILRPIFNSISEIRIRASRAKKARIDASMDNVQLAREKVVLSQEKRENIQPLPRPQTRPIQSSQPATSLSQPQEIVRVLPKLTVPLQTPKSAIPGMPTIPTVFYRDVEQQVKPGQLVALIRADGSPRIEAWDAFKVLLVLGASSSGKTSTMTQIILGFVNGGGMIIPCDAHESKADSLFQKIYPLASALYPGATFASEHRAILENVVLAAALLEERVRGADCSVAVLLVIEELNRLLRDKTIAKQISTVLETLGEEGRGFNIFVVAGCQKVTGLSDIRKSFISYIVHRCDETEAKLVIPQRFAKYCPELRSGQCFVKDADGHTEAGLQVLVARHDIELAWMRLSQHRSTPPNQRRKPTVPLINREATVVPLNQKPRRPAAPFPPSPPAAPRQVQKTRLEPVVQPNPLHIWQAPDNEVEDVSLLFDTPDPVPNALSSAAETEELKPEDLSVSQQFEILAEFRKKKNQK